MKRESMLKGSVALSKAGGGHAGMPPLVDPVVALIPPTVVPLVEPMLPDETPIG
jgi:hypothetical protein